MTSRTIISGWKRAAIAAAVAYALVVQALLLSLSGAVQAAAGPQSFICAQGTQTGSPSAPSKAHDSLCCLLGCHGSGPAGPVPSVAVLHHVAPAAVALPGSGQALALAADSNVLPVGSRAPPRLG